jgi:acyl-CoA reductase-like NAD-dependent aldehyde dehydrogenase
VDRAARLLWKIGAAIEAHRDELAQLETLDNGKPLRESRNVDVPGAARYFKYWSGWPTKICGQTLPVTFPGHWHALRGRPKRASTSCRPRSAT